MVLDLSASADATLTVGGRAVPLRPAFEGGRRSSADGAVRVEVLAPRNTWLHVTVRDGADGPSRSPAGCTSGPRTGATSRPTGSGRR